MNLCCCYPHAHVGTLGACSTADLTDRYVVVVQDRDCRNHTGQTTCDFQDAHVSFFRPGHDCLSHRAQMGDQSQVLAFDSDIFANDADGLGSYTFLYYQYSESLHLSNREKLRFKKLLHDIEEEINYALDEYTNTLTAYRIKILLDYCRRFYHRQFLTRGLIIDSAYHELQHLIDGYQQSDHYSPCLPATIQAQFALRLGMSETYLDDLVKAKTGNSFKQFMNLRIIKLAEHLLADTDLSVEAIAQRLNYPTLQCFCSHFTSIRLCSPLAFRATLRPAKG
ncbi:MAG: helix-turn-helix domain-containing protein [Prevotella sp.]|nr:helix-turn-helix domain-containing protein [Prevotella sp.]MDD7605162.1 helix-turn-helix domain-containing protein [Prevotellaceae bacterium]MDY3248692.1 helix-turn-helix domain-containing protein [Prevotella sp.]